MFFGVLVNWKRIIIFSLVLFSAHVVSGIPFGYFIGTIEAVPLWFGYAQLAVSFSISVIAFIALGRIQQTKRFTHAFVTGLIVTVISALTEALLIGLFTLDTLFIDSLVLLLAITLGTIVGGFASGYKTLKYKHITSPQS